MKRFGIIALCAALLGVLPLQAQQTKLVFGGSVMNHDNLWATDMAQLSQTHVFGTARVMGMGGAFTSLGADLTSMSLNPAGLGMYRRSEISLTPMLSVSHGKTPGTQSWVGNNKTNFAMANVGAALNVFENASKAVTSITLGFGVNRIADFNTRYSSSSESVYNPSQPNNQMPTIADIFAQQLYSSGVKPAKPGAGGSPNGPIYMEDWNPYVWNAILGYDGYLVSNHGTVDEPKWVPDRIGGNASVLHSMDVVNSGSINEFAISTGLNISNFLYLGATIGIQSVHKKVGVTYQEEFGYFNGPAESGGQALAEQIDATNLWQQTVLNGSGVNFKLGAIVRPVAGLRIGAAFHTPTYYSLDRSYRAGIWSVVRDNTASANNTTEVNNQSPTDNQEGDNGWSFTSPTRLMVGASYTFGNVAIVSVDYERAWYNGIRVKDVPTYVDFGPEFYKAEFQNNFRGNNTVRAGLELKPLPMLALRLGGGYSGSMLRDNNFYTNDTYASMPTTYESYYFSAGLGVTLSRSATLDFAYQNMTNKQTQYRLFFSHEENSADFQTWTGLYETSLTRHYIAMTLSFRF